MEFSERVLTARKAKGYSQEDLADIVNVSRQAVSKWETGEAMPDMEKCIALCQALDLSMEYLALGKEVPAVAPAPKKPLRWLGISALAVICLGAGFLTRHFLFQSKTQPVQVPEPETVIQTQVVEKEVIVKVDKNCPVTDVDFQNQRDQGRVRILPATVKEDMQVQIICEDKFGISKTQRIDCTFDGTYFVAYFPYTADRFHYYITAVVSIPEETRQLPILEVEGNASTSSTRHLWKD